MTLADLTASGRATCKVEEVAPILGVSRATAYRLAKTGELPGVRRLGKRFLVSVPELGRWLGADPPQTRVDLGGEAEVNGVEESGGATRGST